MAMARLLLAVALTAGLAAPAAAKTVCGWYTIVHCTRDRTAAEEVVGRGWGALIETSKYRGLRAGFYCVASGPQSRAGAERDRIAARRQGVAAAPYLKRACTDEANLGD